MIVRVQGSGQYRLDEPEVQALHGLDHQLVTAVREHDEVRTHQILSQMIDLVQSRGDCVPDDELVSSGTVLPPDTLSLEEVQELLQHESLIGTAPPAS